jgi:methionyl-tRNA formyltransferase
MWIDKGIDTGNILTTELTTFNGNESLLELHIKVMEHAHSLYLQAVMYLVSGKKQSIPQSEIANGSTYYTKQWTLQQKINLIKNFSNFKNYFDNRHIIDKRKEIRTIELNQN